MIVSSIKGLRKSTLIITILSLTYIPLLSFAAPPATKYLPGETLSPNCAPGSTNCTVIAPANAGANSDITSLTGLTTPLSVAQGGIGANTASGGRTALGAAALGANSDITSLTGLTTPLSVTQGGSGTATALTQGSLIFAGSSGTHSQNNTNLFWDNSNNRLGLGTNSPDTTLDIDGTLAATHVISNGATPTLIAGTGAGTGPTVAVSGTDMAGKITITTGLTPSTSATILTLDFDLDYTSTPTVIFVPANTAAALLSNTSMIHVTSTTANFTFQSGAVALAPTTSYIWNYLVVQ